MVAALADETKPLDARLVAAFDVWLGCYIGAGATDVGALIESNARLLGNLFEDYADRFDGAVAAAITRATRAITAHVVASRVIGPAPHCRDQPGTGASPPHGGHLAIRESAHRGVREHAPVPRRATPRRGPGRVQCLATGQRCTLATPRSSASNCTPGIHILENRWPWP
jgi:hypothetical protein